MALSIWDVAQHRLVVEFNTAFRKPTSARKEVHIEPGMRGRVIGCDDDAGELRITVDFAEFEKFNISFSQVSKQSRARKLPSVRAPKTHLSTERIFWDPKDGDFMDFIRPVNSLSMKLIERHKASGSELSYVEWLESHAAATLDEEVQLSSPPQPSG